MPRIDGQMQTIYQNSRGADSSGGHEVSREEALQLIKRAEEINNTSSCSSYKSASARKGNKDLRNLVADHSSHFSADSKMVINSYLETGHIPPAATGSYVRPGRPTRPSQPARPSAPNTGLNPETPVSGRPPLAGPSPNIPTPVASRPDSAAGSGAIGPNGREVLDFKAGKKTWHCHWFPMQERREGGDSINNLFAIDGALDKLDKLNGGSARAYEFEHNRKTADDGREFGWWGHCNNASEAACILQAPKHAVSMVGQNGRQVNFTPNDIQGLLVKVTPSLINKVDFRGNRFNVAERDDPNDPAPEVFLTVVQDWAKDGMPFVLDIDPEVQVWNYPYDQAKIFESSTPPAHFDASRLAGGRNTLYYHTEMSGTGFNEQKRVYEFYIQKDDRGKVVESAWIKTPNTNNNPDFMWRPHPVGDLTDKSSWRLRDRPSNPQVDPQLVYEIYMKSIA